MSVIGRTTPSVCPELDPTVYLQHGIHPKSDDQYLLSVKLFRDGIKRRVMVKFELPDVSDFEVLTKLTALSPNTDGGIFPVSGSKQGVARLASICGYGAFLRPSFSPGGEMQVPDGLLMVGLDLEQTCFYADGQFPLPHHPLLSSAIYTNKGTAYAAYTCGSARVSDIKMEASVHVVKVEDSRQLIEWIFNWIEVNDPDFIFIHYGFGYDIPRMRVHAHLWRDKYFVDRNLGRKSKGVDLELDYCHVVDTHWFLDKVKRGQFKSLSLDNVCNQLGLGGKSVSPSMSVDPESNPDMTQMLYYNLYDSYLHLALAEKLDLVAEICNLASYSRSTVSDAARYITGTMSAYWSDDRYLGNFIQGAEVFNPIRGMHREVYSYDFVAMYPTIMICSNISTETVDDVTSVFDIKTPGVVKGLVARIDKREASVTSKAVQMLMARRSALGKNTPAGVAVKVLNNSVYGAYSSGRWCITIVANIFTFLGYRIIYGDTDSVFIVAYKMRLELDGSFSTLVMINKKPYYAVHTNGKTKERGLALARKDRMPIVKEALQYCLDTLIVHKLQRVIVGLSQKIRSNKVDPRKFLRERKHKGEIFMEYTDANMMVQVVKEVDFDPKIHICNLDYVVTSIKKTLDTLFSACNLPTCDRMERSYLQSVSAVGHNYMSDFEDNIADNQEDNYDSNNSENSADSSHLDDNASMLSKDYTVPDMIESLLPYRRICNDYFKHKNMLFTAKSNCIAPEYRNTGMIKTTYIPRLYVPIHFIPVYQDSCVKYVTVVNPQKCKTFASIVQMIAHSNNCWILPNFQLKISSSNNMYMKVAKLYVKESAPVMPYHFYNCTTVDEARKTKTSHIDENIYNGETTGAPRFGIYGALHDNSVVDMRHYEAVDDSGDTQSSYVKDTLSMRFDPTIRYPEQFDGTITDDHQVIVDSESIFMHSHAIDSCGNDAVSHRVKDILSSVWQHRSTLSLTDIRGNSNKWTIYMLGDVKVVAVDIAE
ncbi:hypothetical protein BC830DRAFT_1085693, partial [Chytriomyces sp. MP71]